MSQPETLANFDSASREAIPTTEHPVRTSSLPATTTTTAPATPVMEVPANAASTAANTGQEGPYDLLIASAIQAASDAQEHLGSSSPLPENPPEADFSVPRHTVDGIWPEPESVFSAEADKDKGCGLKHWFWACVGGINYLCCMT